MWFRADHRYHHGITKEGNKGSAPQGRVLGRRSSMQWGTDKNSHFEDPDQLGMDNVTASPSRSRAEQGDPASQVVPG